MKGDRLWKAVVGVLSVWAVAASLNTVLSAPRHREILLRKEADLQKIRAQSSRWSQEDQWAHRLDAQQAWKPADLDEVATRTLGGNVAKITPRPALPLANGWQRRETAVDLREVSYAEAALFLSALSEAAPAWRLSEVEFRPSSEAGKGAMTLALESLEKKQP